MEASIKEPSLSTLVVCIIYPQSNIRPSSRHILHTFNLLIQIQPTTKCSSPSLFSPLSQLPSFQPPQLPRLKLPP
ncbi:hypothetical protein CGMCC3_g14904 [Colletotrichum fructicola]|nr:uncharacterized protein CGMCC3_g14904 [Colletotrichum fructicola]KAE9568969.1 hypothetical protein CGMCC3_g14904 [Colletotrichum fructicola]